MKEIGRFNVTREQLDAIFAEGHDGIPVNTMVGCPINVAGFVVYENEDNTKSLKFFDTQGRDYYTGSQVFIKNFIMYLQTKEDDEFPVQVTVKEGTSQKSKRKYLTIEEGSAGANNGAWRNMRF